MSDAPIQVMQPTDDSGSTCSSSRSASPEVSAGTEGHKHKAQSAEYRYERLQLLRAIAEERGGKLMSQEYLGALQKLQWECSEGHVWQTTPSVIMGGSWCRECEMNKQRGTLDEFKQLAAARGGECLSTVYVNAKSKLKFKCHNGHIWEAKANNIKQGQWCRVCARQAAAERQKDTLQTYQNLAKERGGECLSETYVNNHTKLKFKCRAGHLWESLPTSIKKGCWCPECSAGLGERITREFFQQLFGCPFPKSYPEWLKNEQDNQMELDGYSVALGLAFEHQGEHHYSTKIHYSGKEALLKRQHDDAIKKALCEAHNIRLVEIPEVPRLTPLHSLKDFIKEECLKQRVVLPADFDAREVDYLKAYSPNRLEELAQIAASHGGQLKSDHYLGCFEKLLLQCSEGHEWEAAPADIKSGRWCPLCAPKLIAQKLLSSLDDVRKIAEDKGGVCLSDEYFGAHHKYKFRCHLGHEWEASRANITQGKWCPYCADIELANRMRGQNRKNPDGKTGLERCHEIAAQRDGICLSETYISAKSRMRWKCNKDGHEWEACFDSIIRGSWCPHPEHNGGIRLTLEVAQTRARERGGECLSTEYINAQTKMRWRCHEGHEWEDTLNNITNGSWCRQCRSR